MKIGDLVRVKWPWLSKHKLGMVVEFHEDWIYPCFVKHFNGETIYYMEKDLIVVSPTETMVAQGE